MTLLPNINDLNINNAYEHFIEECCSPKLYSRIIDSAKKNRTRINLIIFDVKDKIPRSNIPYCAVLQGTHKTEDQNALYNYWVREFKKSGLTPVIDELDRRLKASEMGYKLRVYKYWSKKWAIELEWENDEKHMEKIRNYKERYGAPF